MGVSSRWNRTGAITDPENVTWATDGAGGRTGTPVSVLASFSYMRWLPSAFSIQTARTEYGINESVQIYNFQGTFSAAVENGHILTETTTNKRFLIHGVRQHRSGPSGQRNSHISGVLEELAESA